MSPYQKHAIFANCILLAYLREEYSESYIEFTIIAVHEKYRDSHYNYAVQWVACKP